MATTIDSDVHREHKVELDPATEGNIQGLINALTTIRDKNAVGADSIVVSISGGTYSFNVKTHKPD